MAEYGSYQTDSTCTSLQYQAYYERFQECTDNEIVLCLILTGEPARALTNPPSAHDVTLSHLMASQAHLGHHPGLTRSSYHPYLAGRRGGVDIIDLSATLPSLRKACGVVRDISRDDGVIVFMGRRHVTKSPVWRAVSRMPGVGHAVTERWRPGSLTNAASVYVLPPRIYRTFLPRSLLTTSQISTALPATCSFGSEYVLNGSYLPDLVVVADPRNMHMLIKECNLKNVPTMGKLLSFSVQLLREGKAKG
jgi:small subunit ribosomal protein S2